jgi:hypothetical protein
MSRSDFRMIAEVENVVPERPLRVIPDQLGASRPAGPILRGLAA